MCRSWIRRRWRKHQPESRGRPAGVPKLLVPQRLSSQTAARDAPPVPRRFLRQLRSQAAAQNLPGAPRLPRRLPSKAVATGMLAPAPRLDLRPARAVLQTSVNGHSWPNTNRRRKQGPDLPKVGKGTGKADRPRNSFSQSAAPQAADQGQLRRPPGGLTVRRKPSPSTPTRSVAG